MKTDLPIPPYTSLYLPIPPYTSLYLPVPPCTSLYLPVLTRYMKTDLTEKECQLLEEHYARALLDGEVRRSMVVV